MSRLCSLAPTPVCGQCGKEEGAAGVAVTPFKKCGGCLAVYYCSKDCARTHWKEGHKSVCRKIR